MTLEVPQQWAGVCELAFGERLAVAEVYAGLLAKEGIDWGLIGPREEERIWERHIVNSLAVSEFIEAGCWIADLGSGAGLPGIPLAIARPDLRIDLVEPMLRRVEFLELCVERLDLASRVRIVRARAEDYAAGISVLTCRALSPVKKLVVQVEHLVSRVQLLALKGSRAELEIEQARDVLQSLHLKATVSESEILGQRIGSVVRISR